MPNGEENNYLELRNDTFNSETPSEDNDYKVLDMKGLGFWKSRDGLTELEGNKAYLYASGLTDFKGTTFDNSSVGDAPVVIDGGEGDVFVNYNGNFESELSD